MSFFSTLANIRIASGGLSIPTWGCWSADFMLATDDAIPDDVEIVIGNLTIHGHVYRQALFAGTREVRVVAGYGGWRKVIPAKQYAFAPGVKLSTIVGDMAIETGEQANVPTDVVVGAGWARENAEASRTLRQLVGTGWYVDNDGVTQIAERSTGAIYTDFSVINQRGSMGKVEIATEDYVSWMPGTTFTAPTMAGTFTNCGVEFRFDNEGTLRMEVLTT